MVTFEPVVIRRHESTTHHGDEHPLKNKRRSKEAIYHHTVPFVAAAPASRDTPELRCFNQGDDGRGREYPGHFRALYEEPYFRRPMRIVIKTPTLNQELTIGSPTVPCSPYSSHDLQMRERFRQAPPRTKRPGLKRLSLLSLTKAVSSGERSAGDHRTAGKPATPRGRSKEVVRRETGGRRRRHGCDVDGGTYVKVKDRRSGCFGIGRIFWLFTC